MLNTLAFSALCACFAFVLVALLADWEATRQMVNSRFRFVPLVRLCRSARGGAALMVGLFMGVSLAATPLFALMAILLAALVTLAGQGGLLAVGAIWQAGLRRLFARGPHAVLCGQRRYGRSTSIPANAELGSA